MSSAATRATLDTARNGRAMTWVLAIMLFLTMLVVAGGIGTARAAATLADTLAARVSVQITTRDPAERERRAAAALAALRAEPAVVAARAVPRAELARLIEPWLGADADDPDLPIPALIDADLSDNGDVALAEVEAAVRRAAPDARIERQTAAMAPVSGLLKALTGVAIGFALLMLAATATVVALAVRAGLETHRATIEVMHALGATDVQVARLFQRRVARDAAIGGLAGGVLALALVLVASMRLAGFGSELIAGIALGTGGWIALAALPVLYLLLAVVIARVAVLRALARTL